MSVDPNAKKETGGVHDADIVAPQRLRDQAGLVGDLLREDDSRPTSFPSLASLHSSASLQPSESLRLGKQTSFEPARPFEALHEEFQRRAKARRWMAGAAVAAVLPWVVYAGAALNEQGLEITREESSLRSAPATLLDARKPASDAETADLGTEAANETTESRTPAARDIAAQETEPARAVPQNIQADEVTKPTLPARVLAKRPTMKDCGGLALSDRDQALTCYRLATEAGGVAGELAFLEIARLERRTLGNNQAALEVLQEYRQKFPQGALLREANLATIDVLIALGRPDQARSIAEKEIKRDPEHATDLTLLTARLAFEGGDCARGRELLESLKASGTSVEPLLPLAQSCR